MPNPFIKAGQLNQSKTPQDHRPVVAFGNTNMPDAPPEVEHYVGDNHPYRGSESHGVADTVDPRDVERTGMVATQEGVTYLPDVVEEPPIPVIIMGGKRAQLIRSRPHKFAWDGNSAIRILSRNESRTYAKIYNSGNQTIAIGNGPSVQLYTGYTLNAANPFLEIRSQDEFWAWNNGAAGNLAEVQIYEEFVVELD